MKRDEKALALLTGVIVGVFATTLTTGVAHWLNGRSWYSDGANEIQWAGGIATFGGIAMLAWWYWSRRCGAPRCVRIGEHPVDGTLRKVCRHHHTREHHELVHDLEGEAHRLAGRLGWGESHGRVAREHSAVSREALRSTFGMDPKEKGKR